MEIEKAFFVTIEGLVQGVGFRPFIYRLAKQFNLVGWVKNTNKNVSIYIEGKNINIKLFINEIKKSAPEASLIENIFSEKTKPLNASAFVIESSENISDEITLVSPDIALCKECLNDLKNQKHRINYPLINCIHCGPRFSIVKDLPYDRENTTMTDFKMCNTCKNEYNNIDDRRFHAQPVACNNCGPKYTYSDGKINISETDKIIELAVSLLNCEKVIAIKGVGGYHLACDATSNKAVNKLRRIKHRESKPFAVMFRNMEIIHQYAEVSSEEEKLLLSWTRPIVLLKRKDDNLADGVCQGFNRVGAFVPFMPFHYLLFEKLKTPAIVLTSGNFSDEPIVINDLMAYKMFHGITDTIVSYNREIHNRTDDSVAIVVNRTTRLIRRSRGYAPSPVKLNFNAEGLLATGAELVNTFCIGKGQQAILSQHIGDLKNYETYEFFSETIEKFKKLFRFKPKMVICDKHPDYLSTRYAMQSDLPVIQVQHHYAHIASSIAINKINEKVIGFSFDGTGYGDDGRIWGGEVFLCDLYDYERKYHLEYLPLPGGDKAVEEPWRIAVSYLYKTYGYKFLKLKLPLLKKFENKIPQIIEIIDRNINCPETSSMGRFFDAVAALTDICLISDFHAEAPMRLENEISENISSYYDFEITKSISLKSIIRQITEDILDGRNKNEIATKFHNTIIKLIFAIALKIRNETGVNKVVLSGGSFQNQYILDKTEKNLRNNKFEVLSSGLIPCNDAGIALGQLAIAANKVK